MVSKTQPDGHLRKYVPLVSVMQRRCDRCHAYDCATTMSMFNTDTICMDCACKERSHPRFAAACSAEAAAINRGDFNFPGIGKPADL